MLGHVHAHECQDLAGAVGLVEVDSRREPRGRRQRVGHCDDRRPQPALEEVLGQLAPARPCCRVRRHEAAVRDRVARRGVDHVKDAEHDLDHALHGLVEQRRQEGRAPVLRMQATALEDVPCDAMPEHRDAASEERLRHGGERVVVDR